jgi:hypothetical protein
MNTDKLHLSSAEEQLIECIRETTAAEDFCVTVKAIDGTWEIYLADGKSKGRGVGPSFDRAWVS